MTTFAHVPDAPVSSFELTLPQGKYSALGAITDLCTSKLAILLDAPARAAGLFPTMHEFNLGDSINNYRVPDGGLHRARYWGTWEHTAPLVVEIISPGDETWQKLPHYAAHEVDEVLILDPEERAVHWLGLDGGEYRVGGPLIARSGLIDLGPSELAERIDWP